MHPDTKINSEGFHLAGSGFHRVLTALIGIPLFIGPMYVGGIWFTLLISFVVVLAQYELYRMQSRLSWSPSVLLSLLLGALIVFRDERALAPEWLPVVLLLVLLDSLRKSQSGHRMGSAGGAVFGIVYPALFLSFLPNIRNGLDAALGESYAFGLTLLMVSLIWICDSAAYYVGRAVGKTPLTPVISPKKTIEGAAGGVAGAILGAAAARFFIFPFLTWIDVLAFGLIAGVVGQLGDLVESAMKRSADVKDSGSLLPGHGGFLDRFDSLILATPVYYLYLIMATNYLG